MEVHDNLGTIVGAGIDTFWVRRLPAGIQVMLAVRLLAMADEIGDVKHAIKNRILDPSGKLLGETKGEFAVGGPEAARPDWLTGITIPSAVRFQATVEGAYMIELAVDEDSKSLPIHVVHGAPGGA